MGGRRRDWGMSSIQEDRGAGSGNTGGRGSEGAGEARARSPRE